MNGRRRVVHSTAGAGWGGRLSVLHLYPFKGYKNTHKPTKSNTKIEANHIFRIIAAAGLEIDCATKKSSRGNCTKELPENILGYPVNDWRLVRQRRFPRLPLPFSASRL